MNHLKRKNKINKQNVKQKVGLFIQALVSPILVIEISSNSLSYIAFPDSEIAFEFYRFGY